MDKPKIIKLCELCYEDWLVGGVKFLEKNYKIKIVSYEKCENK